MTSDTKEHGEPVMKPCPFCGDSGMPRFLSAIEARRPTSCVTCGRCCTDGPPGLSREQAIDRWNQRPTPERPPHQGLIEEERKLIVDALMEKHIHHAQHAANYGDQEGFQGHEPLAKRCKLLADAIMDRAIAALEVQRPAITQETLARKYATHQTHCHRVIGRSNDCTCGLDAALEAASAPEGQAWSAQWKPDQSKPVCWVNDDGRVMWLAHGEAPQIGAGWKLAGRLA